MAEFRGVDFLDCDSLLSEDERAVRDTIRDWVDEQLLPVIGECYVEHRFPMGLIPQMGELGVFGATLPASYGCAELNNVAYGLLMQELERGRFRGAFFRQRAERAGDVPDPRVRQLKSRRMTWLPKMAAGEVIGCFGLTEPDFGSNPGGMITKRREGRERLDPQRHQDVDHQRLRWRTSRSSGPRRASWTTAKSVRGFIVETDRDGYVAKDQKGKLSLLASDTSEISLQDVRVPAENMLPGSSGPEESVDVPQRGPLRHRLG